jgi:pimeloyl-ACP methyl ester carboxylesterase
VSAHTGTTVAPDGTPIAWVRTGSGSPVVLVHGAAADHTAWRTTGPFLATRHTLYAIDRRGHGASGDTPPYAIAREYEDLAAVVDAIAGTTGRPVDVVGHSYGGRVALGAALLTPNLRRLVSYEGAPAPGGRSFHGDRIMERLEAYRAADDREELLVCFMIEVVGMTPAELAAFRASPTWPSRVEIAPTVVREMWAEAGEEAGPERFAAVRIPVLQVLGGASSPLFTDGTRALDRLLPDARVVVIDGARHAAHHTHADRFADAVRRFLEADLSA